MALGMIDAVSETGRCFGETLEARIGIHYGEVVAGIIGQHWSIYDVWGDTVNTASRGSGTAAPRKRTLLSGLVSMVEPDRIKNEK